MIILRQKVFFEYGITSANIQEHAKANNMSVKNAYDALKTQRAGQGIGQEAFKAGDKSLFRADTIRATKDSASVLGQSAGGKFGFNNYKASATSSSAANTKFNKAYNMGKTSGVQVGMKAGQSSVGVMGGMKNTWNNMGAMGKGATIAAAAGLTALAAKGVKSMIDKKKDKE